LNHLTMLHMTHSFDMSHRLYSLHFHPINNMMDYMTILVHFHIPGLHLNTLSLRLNLLRYFHLNFHLMN